MNFDIIVIIGLFTIPIPWSLGMAFDGIGVYKFKG